MSEVNEGITFGEGTRLPVDTNISWTFSLVRSSPLAKSLPARNCVHGRSAGRRSYMANPVTPVPNTQYTVNLRPIQGPGSSVQAVDLALLLYDEWHTYRVMVQAVTRHQGSVTVYKDNVLISTMSEQPTLWSLGETEVFVNYVDGKWSVRRCGFRQRVARHAASGTTRLTVQ